MIADTNHPTTYLFHLESEMNHMQRLQSIKNVPEECQCIFCFDDKLYSYPLYSTNPTTSCFQILQSPIKVQSRILAYPPWVNNRDWSIIKVPTHIMHKRAFNSQYPPPASSPLQCTGETVEPQTVPWLLLKWQKPKMGILMLSLKGTRNIRRYGYGPLQASWGHVWETMPIPATQKRRWNYPTFGICNAMWMSEWIMPLSS